MIVFLNNFTFFKEYYLKTHTCDYDILVILKVQYSMK